jgi:hypothetical protein
MTRGYPMSIQMIVSDDYELDVRDAAEATEELTALATLFEERQEAIEAADLRALARTMSYSLSRMRNLTDWLTNLSHQPEDPEERQPA